jgi:hypothetical protein
MILEVFIIPGISGIPGIPRILGYFFFLFQKCFHQISGIPWKMRN